MAASLCNVCTNRPLERSDCWTCLRCRRVLARHTYEGRAALLNRLEYMPSADARERHIAAIAKQHDIVR